MTPCEREEQAGRPPRAHKPESALVFVDGGEAVSVDGVEVVLVWDA